MSTPKTPKNQRSEVLIIISPKQDEGGSDTEGKSNLRNLSSNPRERHSSPLNKGKPGYDNSFSGRLSSRFAACLSSRHDQRLIFLYLFQG